MAIRSVLLADADLEALGDLASKLRARGLKVTVADGGVGLVERARSARPDAILFALGLPNLGEAERALNADQELGSIPRFRLDVAVDADSLARTDPDAIVQRMMTLPPRSGRVEAPERDDFRGDLQQLGVVDLLQLLIMNRRSGVLTLVTPRGSGEVRLADGEILDAVHRRLEGDKALFRMLAFTEGSFTFASAPSTGIPGALGFGGTPASAMRLMEGLRQLDELKRTRDVLAVDEDTLVGAEPPEDADDVARWVMTALSRPRTLDELLDDVAVPDLEIANSVKLLLERGCVRLLPRRIQRAPLAAPEQLSVLGAVLSRLRAPGFAGPPRLVLAAEQAALRLLTRSLQGIVDVTPAAGGPPASPVPYPLGTVRVLEGVELEVLGLPEDAQFAALWQLALAGAAVVVSLAPPTPALEEAAELGAVPVLQAGRLVPGFEAERPLHVAALLREALLSVADR